MTALISAFSRAYHAENNEIGIFNDYIAKSLFKKEEYAGISNCMSDGINFFNPSFKGSREAALRWVVDNQLSPSPLGRAAFAEKALQTAVSCGASQYLILGAGYDTFAYRQPYRGNKLQIFEIDHPAAAQDKRMRLDTAKIKIPDNVHYIEADFTSAYWRAALTNCDAFDCDQISFCSILGVIYYLAKQDFEKLLSVLETILPDGSAVIFDYPDENSYTEKAGERAKKQVMMAAAANERMLARYSYTDIEKLLSDCGFLIYEHLSPLEITQQYFENYNHANPSHPMTAFDNVNYCLAVKHNK